MCMENVLWVIPCPGSRARSGVWELCLGVYVIKARCARPGGEAAEPASWRSGLGDLGALPGTLISGYSMGLLMINVGTAASSALRMWCCHAAFGVAQGTRFVTVGKDEEFVLVWQSSSGWV